MTEPGAEEAVLGAMLLSTRAVRDAVSVLRPDDFYAEDNRRGFEAITALFAAGKPIDVVSVTHAMRDLGTLPPRGPLFVRDLAEACPTPASAPHYAELVRGMALKRRIAQAAGRIGEMVSANGRAPDEVAQLAQDWMREAVADESTADVIGWTEVVEQASTEMEREAADPRTIPTRIPRLDQTLDGGLHGGRLYVLGARPKVGKSALATNIVRRALDAGRTVLFLSLEMTGPEVLGRLLADRFSIDARNRDVLAARMFDPAVAGWDLRFMQLGNVLTLTARARQIMPDLVIVDYVQLLPTVMKHERRDLEIATYTRALKLLAIEMHRPVLVLSQVNRGPEGRTDRRPRMSDLRESGTLEADPDVVMILHRDVDRESREAELAVLGNRHGPGGMIPLVFDAVHTRFSEMETRLGGAA